MLALLAATIVATSVTNAQGVCTPPRAAVDSWSLTRATGLTLRVPPGFRRGASAGGAAASLTAHWADSARSQLTIRRVAPTEGALAPLPSAEGRVEYRRCEERAGSATAVIVSFQRPPEPPGAPQATPFHVHARFHWPDGEIVEATGWALDRARFEELLAAVRTVRRSAA
jgi:hypothetical protein